MAAKLRATEGRDIHHRRFHLAEMPFAILKSVMGIRQFLLRGLEKVRTEWLWACTAYNLKKLAAAVVAPRAAAAVATKH
jgi:hypothetical protein